MILFCLLTAEDILRSLLRWGYMSLYLSTNLLAQLCFIALFWNLILIWIGMFFRQNDVCVCSCLLFVLQHEFFLTFATLHLQQKNHPVCD